ncbi:MAG: SNF2 helicase associated domain-containing protein, partial [Holdemanella sp.]|nr:SNF2 helicase associated domain-containing protein [Holdemanella sp.]
MYIDESTLFRYIRNTWLFYQAEDSYYTGNLETISVFKGIKDGKHFYKVQALFLEGRKKNNVQFNVSHTGVILSTNCSCKSRKNEGCIHLVAACKAVNELQPDTFPFRINYREYLEEKEREERLKWLRYQIKTSTESVFTMADTVQKDAISKLVMDDTKTIRLEIDTDKANYCEGDIEIGCKIGIDKMYRVKDIHNLVVGFMNHDTYPLGKFMAIELNRDRLDEDSQKILSFLSAYSNPEQWKRTGMITGRILDSFFDMLRDLPEDRHPFLCVERILVLPLIIEEDDECYIIKRGNLKNGSYRASKKYLYEVDGDDLYRYKMDSDGFLVKLLYKIEEEKALYIQKDKLKSFYLKCIRPYKEHIQLSTNLDLSIYETEIRDITLYSDLQDAQVRVWGNYVQDGIEKKLFDEGSVKEISAIEAIVKHYANSVADNIATFKTRGAQLNAFLDKGIPALMEQAKVYVSEDLVKLKDRKSVNLSMGVQLHNNLLEMNIDSSDVSREELIHILNAYRRKKKFYRLKNGDMIDLEQEAIKDFDELVNQMNLSTKDLQKEIIKKPAYQMMHLEDLDEIEFRKDESINQYVKNLENLSKNEVKIPDKYNDLLREYQKKGIEWLYASA